MRRWMCAALALALCFALAAAVAEGDAKLLYELSDVEVSWIQNTDLLMIYGDNGNGIAEMDGTPLTENLYFQMRASNGLVIAHKNGEGDNIWGAVDATGAEVLPFQYGDIKVASPQWALGFVLSPTDSEDDYDYYGSDSNYVIDSVDIYSLAAPGEMRTLTRDQYANSYAYGDLLNVQDRTTGVVSTYDAQFNVVYDDLNGVYQTKDEDAPARFYEEGKYGLKDAQENVLLEPTFDSIDSFDLGYARMALDGLYGLIDEAGNVVVPARYDEIQKCFHMPYDGESFEVCGYFCVVKDGKLGYVGANGEESCPPKYDAESLTNYGASACGEIDGKIVVVAADGAETALSDQGYSDARVGQNCSGLFYIVTDAEGRNGVVDLHGNVLLPCEYNTLTLSGSGRCALVQRGYGEPFEIYELSEPALGA